MTNILKFSTKLFLIISFILAIHIGILYLLELPLFDNMILASYGVNFILAIGIYAGLFIIKDNQPNNLGFIFMAGSMIKFGVFFLVFFRSYKLDGEMSSLEFSSFFIPYALCLVIETIYLAKLLKSLD